MTSAKVSALDIVRQAQARLAQSGNGMARRDAELLLCHILQVDPARLPLIDVQPSESELLQFDQYIDDRLTGKPVAYIIGEQDFWSLTFEVNSHTLIPRPDTETLVSSGLECLPPVKSPRILDLGTGSGCILLSLLHEVPGATGIGVDVSEEALGVARKNANRHELEGRAQFVRSDWFETVPGGEHFDLIVSNPPYIENDTINTLMRDVRDFEPTSALMGGPDGLDCYRAITSDSPQWLTSGGVLAVEVGIAQADDVSALLVAAGLELTGVRHDLAGVERVVIGKKA